MNYAPNSSLDNENLNREEFEVETINIESAKVFRQYGGIDVSFFSIYIVCLLFDLNFNFLFISKIFKRILLMNLLVNNKINTTSSIINNGNDSKNSNNNIKNLFNNNHVDNKKTIFTPFNPTIYNNNFNNNQTSRSIRYLNNNGNNQLDINSNNNFEKCCILRIKCKCIQILNRLICLVSIFLCFISIYV